MTQLCTEDGCTNVAAFIYCWPWENGDGACCPEHKPVVETRAVQIGRPLTFHPLLDAPAPTQNSLVEIAKLGDERQLPSPYLAKLDGLADKVAELDHLDTMNAAGIESIERSVSDVAGRVLTLERSQAALSEALEAQRNTFQQVHTEHSQLLQRVTDLEAASRRGPGG